MDFLIQMVGSRPIKIIAVLCGLANVTLIIRALDLKLSVRLRYGRALCLHLL